MYVSQILPQTQTPYTLQPTTTTYTPVLPQQNLSYTLVPQPQVAPINIMTQIPVSMPTYQTPSQPAISYEKFIPPTPMTKFSDNAPKIYQFYKYVPVVNTTQVTQNNQQVAPAVPEYKTVTFQTTPNVIYQVIQ